MRSSTLEKIYSTPLNYPYFDAEALRAIEPMDLRYKLSTLGVTDKIAEEYGYPFDRVPEMMVNGPAVSVEDNSEGGSGTDEKSGGLVNINTATRDELMTLPGIGEAKADMIISYRDEHGCFNSIEDIMNISGIKTGVYNKIKDRITVQR